jgi:hypothetical protein
MLLMNVQEVRPVDTLLADWPRNLKLVFIGERFDQSSSSIPLVYRLRAWIKHQFVITQRFR